MPPRPRKGIRSLSRPIEYGADGDFSGALQEISEAPDRVTAIVGAAVVEDALRWALNSFFMLQISEQEDRELFEDDGILSSFYAKILMGFALGLFREAARNDLIKIKNIRNAFAHVPRSISFETTEIVSECRNLRYVDAIARNPARTILHPEPFGDQSPRERFVQTVRIFILDLHVVGSRGDEAELGIKQLGGMP